MEGREKERVMGEAYSNSLHICEAIAKNHKETIEAIFNRDHYAISDLNGRGMASLSIAITEEVDAGVFLHLMEVAAKDSCDAFPS